MFDVMKLRQLIGGQLVRAGKILNPGHRDRGVYHEFPFSNHFVAQQVRNGRVIKTVQGYNGVTVVGKNYLLDMGFGNSSPLTPIDPWYIGLINNSPTPVLSETDTLASHTGFTEWTNYSGNRKTWDDTNAASKIKGTNTASSFTINATGVLYGILVASAASGTSGTLWATGAFDSTLSVVNTDVINVTYGIRL